MIEILSTIGNTMANLLVIIGLFIIVSGAIKILIEFIMRYERSRKEKGHETEQFSLTRSHLSFSIILALSLFIIKLANYAVRAHLSEAYIYIAVFVAIIIVMVVSYGKVGAPKKTMEAK